MSTADTSTGTSAGNLSAVVEDAPPKLTSTQKAAVTRARNKASKLADTATSGSLHAPLLAIHPPSPAAQLHVLPASSEEVPGAADNCAVGIGAIDPSPQPQSTREALDQEVDDFLAGLDFDGLARKRSAASSQDNRDTERNPKRGFDIRSAQFVNNVPHLIAASGNGFTEDLEAPNPLVRLQVVSPGDCIILLVSPKPTHGFDGTHLEAADSEVAFFGTRSRSGHQADFVRLKVPTTVSSTSYGSELLPDCVNGVDASRPMLCVVPGCFKDMLSGLLAKATRDSGIMIGTSTLVPAQRTAVITRDGHIFESNEKKDAVTRANDFGAVSRLLGGFNESFDKLFPNQLMNKAAAEHVIHFLQLATLPANRLRTDAANSGYMFFIQVQGLPVFQDAELCLAFLQFKWERTNWTGSGLWLDSFFSGSLINAARCGGSKPFHDCYGDMATALERLQCCLVALFGIEFVRCCKPAIDRLRCQRTPYHGYFSDLLMLFLLNEHIAGLCHDLTVGTFEIGTFSSSTAAARFIEDRMDAFRPSFADGELANHSGLMLVKFNQHSNKPAGSKKSHGVNGGNGGHSNTTSTPSGSSTSSPGSKKPVSTTTGTGTPGSGGGTHKSGGKNKTKPPSSSKSPARTPVYCRANLLTVLEADSDHPACAYGESKCRFVHVSKDDITESMRDDFLSKQCPADSTNIFTLAFTAFFE